MYNVGMFKYKYYSLSNINSNAYHQILKAFYVKFENGYN